MGKDNNKSEQKSQKPTTKRLRDARKKGQVAFSRDANGIVVFAAGAAGLWALTGAVHRGFEVLLRQASTMSAADQVDGASLNGALAEALLKIPGVIVPFLFLTAGLGVLMGAVQTRFMISHHPIKPKWERINPAERIKQIFSILGFFELVKAIVKLIAVFAISAVVLGGSAALILKLGFVELDALMLVLSRLITKFVVAILCVFTLLAAGDFLFQRWRWLRDLRMSKYEVKREHKETEGDPLIKSRRRVIHREISNEDLRKAVVEAEVVLVNPTHIAVVLGYNRGEMPAPKVTAKGHGPMAKRIIALAGEVDRPVMRNIPLARALARVEVGGFVPPPLWSAVAEILNLLTDVQRMTPGPGEQARAS